jgi:hypothetical protein
MRLLFVALVAVAFAVACYDVTERVRVSPPPPVEVAPKDSGATDGGLDAADAGDGGDAAAALDASDAEPGDADVADVDAE